MKTKHVCELKRARKSSTVDTCYCGKFQHNENNKNPVITEQRAVHTPTPWKARQWGQTITIGNGEIDGVAFVNPHGNSNKGIPDRQDSVNAAFIVKAVNCYEDLLQAVTLARAYMMDETEETDDNVLDRLSEVIAKAEGS